MREVTHLPVLQHDSLLDVLFTQLAAHKRMWRAHLARTVPRRLPRHEPSGLQRSAVSDVRLDWGRLSPRIGARASHALRAVARAAARFHARLQRSTMVRAG